ncbi:uncharacterized protein LOC144146853 isoform X2 [Haemaphysalis longicornis]
MTRSELSLAVQVFCGTTIFEVKGFLGAACIAITFLTGMTLRTTGLFFVIFLEEFGVSRQQAAWPLSVTSAAVAFSGTGSGLVFVLTGFFIDKTFTTKRRLLMNFNIAAFCAAGVVFPEIILYVTGMFGGNGILLFAGGLLLPALALCVFIAMYESLQANKASSDTKHSSNSSTTPKSWEPLVKPSVRPSRAWETGSMYKRPLFYVTAVTHLFFFYVFNLISNVAVDAVLGKGVPIKLTVAIAPVASVFDCLGRVVVPMATEAGYVSRSTLITIDYAAIGVGLLILSFLRDFPKLLVTASIVGMFNGHATAVHSTLMADAVGTSQLRRSNNIVTCVTSLAFLTKPILIGYFKDVHNTYSHIYQLSSSLMFFSALVWLCVRLLAAYLKRRTWTATDDMEEESDAPSLITYRSMDLTSLMA